jgi:hypothetical protein
MVNRRLLQGLGDIAQPSMQQSLGYIPNTPSPKSFAFKTPTWGCVQESTGLTYLRKSPEQSC